MGSLKCAMRFFGALLLALALPALLPSCDMFQIPDGPPANSGGGRGGGPGAGLLSDSEKEELERSGHFLKLINMPRNTQATNVSSALAANSAQSIAKLKARDAVKIYRDQASGTSIAYLPLIYNDGTDFAETGSFYVAFTIHVDAVTSFAVSVPDKVLVEFEDGRGALDALTIPVNGPYEGEHRFLTIYGLPPNLQAQNVSKVFVYNSVGAIAQCEDYGLVSISSNASGSTLRIPLCYIKPPELFTETGSFFVSFDINVDAVTRFVITQNDRLLVNFANGNGALYADDLPVAPPLPFLTIKSLPRHAVKNNFSNVFLYNTVGKVAECANVQDIIVARDAMSATAHIPLVYSSDAKEYFYDSGYFIVSFTITVDAITQILVAQSDSLLLQFANGSGTYDLSDRFGYFSGGLANPDNAAAPLIAKDTSFEMNGTYFKVKANTAPKNSPPGGSSVLYVYASQNVAEVEFEYSAAAPVYVASRKAYYSGDKRCLWKLIFFKDSPADLYAAKTYIADGWPHLARYAVGSPGTAASYCAPHYSLLGSSNPAPATVTLQPGAYVFTLLGAGGGSGGGGGAGGQGGLICELVLVASPTTFTAFAGAGGGAGGGGSISWSIESGSNGTIGGYCGGGGGGGSGSYLFSAAGYFLCAGGGGGGSGAANKADINHPSFVEASCIVGAPGGAGGAGGSAGPGGGGGSDGRYYYEHSRIESQMLVFGSMYNLYKSLSGNKTWVNWDNLTPDDNGAGKLQ